MSSLKKLGGLIAHDNPLHAKIMCAAKEVNALFYSS
jgi:hypothetical protein